MTKQTLLNAPETGIAAFPLDALYLSPMNPRQDADPEGIELLADSIAICGLIQNLAGIEDETGKVAIVAGGRRLRALIRAFERDADLLSKRPELATIPVRLARSEAEAQAWASAENAARSDLHPADEIRAYGRMRDAGADVARIARIFGTTEKQVYRRLALADLPVPVLDALKAGEISLGIAAAFTVANDEDHALVVLRQVLDASYPLSEHRVKAMLQPVAISLGDRRAQFVGLEAYEAEGGKITRDLFEDSAFLQDAEIVDRLFNEKLDAAAEHEKAEGGWKWVQPIELSHVPYNAAEKMQRLYPVEGSLTEEQAERYDELAELAEAQVLDEAGEAELEALQRLMDSTFTETQRAHSGVFLYVNNKGEIELNAAFVRPEDAAEATAAGVLTGHAAKAASDAEPKSPYSAALAEDMHRARLHAVQAALLAKPELVLDLLAFTLSGRGGEFETVLGIRRDRASVTPEKAEGLDADPRLEDQRSEVAGWMDDEAQAQAFTQFQAEGKKARNAVLTRELARTLAYPHRKRALFDQIETLAGADLRQVWTPTAEGFFSRISGDHLDALLLDLTGCDPNGSGFKTFKACKKADKARQMERLFTDPEYQKAWRIDTEKKARIDAWKPDCL